MPTIAEAAQLVLGSGVLTGAVAYSIQKVPLALVEYRKKRLELEEQRKRLALEAEEQRKRLVLEAKKLDAEKDRAWEENTGRIYRDQRTDLEKARHEADTCQEAIRKLDNECKARDAANQAELAAHKARLESQQGEINSVRAALAKLDQRLSRT